MNKNRFFILLSTILFLASIGLVFLFRNIFSTFDIYKKIKGNKELKCVTNSDCILMETHPKYMGKCVNKEWGEEWNNDSESEKVFMSCVFGPVCWGEDMPENPCECVDKHCQPIDMNKYPECDWSCP